MLVYIAFFSKLNVRKQGVVLMQQIGIYEQLITQVIEQNLNRDTIFLVANYFTYRVGDGNQRKANADLSLESHSAPRSTLYPQL